MNQLAAYIREGLKLGIRESPSSRLIHISFDGESGNILAIALAGKLGIKEARKRIELSQRPGRNREKAERRVLDELNLSLDQGNTLSSIHHEHDALEIAAQLEAGWTLDATWNVVFSQKDVFDTP